MRVEPKCSNFYKIAFKDRMRMHSSSNHQKLVRSKNNPDLYFYIYEDSNTGIDVSDRTYDSFTGLRDKNYLLAVLKKEIKECVQNGKNLSIAMFDMDNFKSVNEFLGYETGDDFIKYISDSVDKTAKANSVNAYRFGGEEFVIVFENQDTNKQKEIVNDVLNAINTNTCIKSKEELYTRNAKNRLFEYSVSTEKIDTLLNLKTKKQIYEDLIANLSDSAKNDPYLLTSLKAVNDKLNSMYLYLLSESIKLEDDKKIKIFLTDMANSFEKQDLIDEEKQKELDEYLLYRYDKSAEMYQIKKWLMDFDNNKGFSITGGAMTFKPDFMKIRTPMDLIGVAGEILKRGKQTKKGKGYYSNI